MSLLQPVGVTRLYRMIADQIKSRIDAGHFTPGERLPSERELAELLEVSRASVREALIALEIEGYVDVRVGTGVFVTQRTENGSPQGSIDSRARQPCRGIGVFELLETRLLLEPHCAKLAASNATTTHVAAIEAAAHAMHGSQRPSDHDRAFHLAIANACGNGAMASTVAHLCMLREDSAIFSRLDGLLVTGKEWAIAEEEHIRILKAILARDAAAAGAAMLAHLRGVRDRLYQDFGGDEELSRLGRA
jgi:DNA-binding FadR family transcriptional regulator